MKSRDLGTGLAVAGGIIIIFFLSLSVGSHESGTGLLGNWLTNKSLPGETTILSLRASRMLMAFLTGASLSVAGIFMQALLRNPLADPYVLGLSSGAGLGANLLLTGFYAVGSTFWFALPLAAFAGSLLSAVPVGWASIKYRDSGGYPVLLTGMALSSLFTAFSGLLIYLYAENDSLRAVIFWTLGSFNKSSWEGVSIAAVMAILITLYGLRVSRQLDILLLGTPSAHALGVPIHRIRTNILIICALCIGSITAFTGPVGFIGLVIPHFCRSLVGISHRKTLILAPFFGGAYLASCDLLNRMILPPAGLPIGIITALFGIPFFIYLLWKEKARQL